MPKPAKPRAKNRKPRAIPMDPANRPGQSRKCTNCGRTFPLKHFRSQRNHRRLVNTCQTCRDNNRKSYNLTQPSRTFTTKEAEITSPHEGARKLMAIVCQRAVEDYKNGCPVARTFLLSERGKKWHELLGVNYRAALEYLGLLDDLK